MRRLRNVLLALLALLAAARVALPGLIRARVNEKLDSLPGGYRGQVGDVSLALHRGTVSLEEIELQDAKRDLVVSVKELRLRVRLKELLKKRVVAGADLEKPVIRIAVRRAMRRAKAVAAREKEERRKQAERGEAAPEEPPKPLPDMLAEATAFRVERVEVRDGELVVIESGLEARISDVQVMMEGLTNEKEGRNARLEAAARIMEKGKASLTVRADPLAKNPSFDLTAKVEDVDLPSINPLLRWQMGVDVERGTFEALSELDAKDGAFEGYVKPFVDDLKMLKAEELKNPAKAVKEAVIGAVAAVLKNEKSRAVATRVPVKGKLEDPQVGVWSAVVSVLRNAFVEALRPSFDGAKS